MTCEFVESGVFSVKLVAFSRIFQLTLSINWFTYHEYEVGFIHAIVFGLVS